VALAVIVENAGFGSTSAAPIARRVFDYLLLGQYPSEEDIVATREGSAPRRADVWASRARSPRCPAFSARRPHGAMQGPPMSTSSSAVAVAAAAAGLSASTARCWRRAAAGGLGLVTMYSAGFDHGTRFVDHGRNMLLALA
jgi:penicillin-binding protein 2